MREPSAGGWVLMWHAARGDAKDRRKKNSCFVYFSLKPIYAVEAHFNHDRGSGKGNDGEIVEWSTTNTHVDTGAETWRRVRERAARCVCSMTVLHPTWSEKKLVSTRAKKRVQSWKQERPTFLLCLLSLCCAVGRLTERH